MSTTRTKFLCLYRFPAGYRDDPEPASPEAMQAQYEAWTAWMAKFEKELIPGGPLKPEQPVRARSMIRRVRTGPSGASTRAPRRHPEGSLPRPCP